MTYQNYSHYKLPITIEPLEYGKLIEQIGNKYIIQLTTFNLVVINQIKNDNFVKFFRKGELLLEFKDTKISDNSFARYIENQRYIFENNILIRTEILVLDKYIETPPNLIKILFRDYRNWSLVDWIITIYIYSISFILIFIIPLYILYLIFFTIFPDNDLMTHSFVGGLKLLNKHKYNFVKLRKVRSLHKWEDLEYKVNKHTFSAILFKSLLNRFWTKIENQFNEDNHMFILFKIKYITGETLSIGNLQRLNKDDKMWYIQFMLDFISLKSEYYNENKIDAFIFSYGFKNGKAENKYAIPFSGSYQTYGSFQLPISMNPLDYGKLANKIESENNTIYIIHNEKGETISFIVFKDYNDIKISKFGNTLLTFKDMKSDSGFIRIVNNKKFYFQNGVQILFTNEINTNFISKIAKSKRLFNNFITIDIETYIVDGLLKPYLICFYDGKEFFSFYLSDYNSVEHMMLDCLNSILKRKYNYYKVYAHNMAKFDIIFLLKYLVKLGKIKPIIHNGKIISVTIVYGDNEQYKIEFKDSILLLLYSLKSLCSSFKIDEAKSIFPHLFVNKDNLEYNGDVPRFNDFIEISVNDYQNYKNSYNIWSLKKEAIKYCKIDCVSLHKILLKFNEMIFKLFSINIHHYPTLSSLAFAIFRSNFMKKENNIPQLSGKIANDIRQGYTGGAVDMYIPESKPSKNIYCYDVNSLYPSQMQSQLMPVGNPTFFEGDIRKIDLNAFGFFYCKIIAPNDIKHPILQTRVKINGTYKTIAPIGSWEDMLFSEELKNAKKYGYEIDVLWGYTFNAKNIFKEYVEFLYNLRLEYPKSDPMNFIAKILLNSLYGRFGMDDNFENINIIHKDYYSDFENKFIDLITDKIELDDYILVFYKANEEIIDDQGEHNVSVSIAAAITAYSRIHMSQFKNNEDINLYYSDTDSIYTDSKIDDSFIDNKVFFFSSLLKSLKIFLFRVNQIRTEKEILEISC